MIKSWPFEFFPEKNVDAETGGNARYVQDYLDLWVRDEALGFDGIFFSEHHFGGSFSTSPNLLIAATAVRTSRLRLGVMGIVSPYYSPLRIAEEIGLLDQISRGRLEIGLSIGVPQELMRLGISMERGRALHEETLDILGPALQSGVLNHHGRNFTFENVRILPPVLQRPHPPIWTTVISESSAARAAANGHKISTGFHSPERVRSIFDAYRAEAEKAGRRNDPDSLGLRRRVVIAGSRSEALEMSDRVAERLKAFAADDTRLKLSKVPDEPGAKQSGFSLSEDEFLAGTPKDVAEMIVEQCRFTGAGNFLAVIHWGAEFDEIAQGHELYAREVLPLLQKV